MFYDGTLPLKQSRQLPTVGFRRWLLIALWLPPVIAGIAAVALVLAGVAPTIVGYNSYVITGPRMEPAIKPGSIVVSRPTQPEALAVGDIITFRRPENPNTNITHRITAINYEHGQRVFVTKGDANKDIDPEVARLQGEVDRMAYAVPYAGYILKFARSFEGIVALLFAPILGLIGLELLSLRRRHLIGMPSTNRPDTASMLELYSVKDEVRRLQIDLTEFRTRLQEGTNRAAPAIMAEELGVVKAEMREVKAAILDMRSKLDAETNAVVKPLEENLNAAIEEIRQVQGAVTYICSRLNEQAANAPCSIQHVTPQPSLRPSTGEMEQLRWMLVKFRSQIGRAPAETSEEPVPLELAAQSRTAGG